MGAAHPPVVAALYGAGLAVLFLVLSSQVIRARRAARVALGTGEDEGLLRAVRAHGNFAEYVPLALLLLALAEATGAARPLLHALGLALLVARVAHAWGISQPDGSLRFRILGMVGTFAVLAAAAALCAWGWVRA